MGKEMKELHVKVKGGGGASGQEWREHLEEDKEGEEGEESEGSGEDRGGLANVI